MTLTVEEPRVLLDLTVAERAGTVVVAAVMGGAAGGFDPVIGGIIGALIGTGGLIAVALIGRTGKATPPDDDDVHVRLDEWELRVPSPGPR